MFYQIFLSLQVKRSSIISNKHGLYELLHQLPNDLRLKIPHGIFADGEAQCPHKKKKKTQNLKKLRKVRRSENFI